jgi:hypothetical protein
LAGGARPVLKQAAAELAVGSAPKAPLTWPAALVNIDAAGRPIDFATGHQAVFYLMWVEYCFDELGRFVGLSMAAHAPIGTGTEFTTEVMLLDGKCGYFLEEPVWLGPILDVFRETSP